MHRTLRALVCDLEIRCTVLLESLPASPATEISGRVNEIREKIKGLSFEARALLSEDLEEPTRAAEHYQTFMNCSRILFTSEHFDLPVILRWGEDDRQITAMCWALLDQVGWPLARPYVGAFSSDYYWAFPLRDIIAVPANEHERLLGIGDLAHELGHLAVASKEAVLVEHARTGNRTHQGGGSISVG